MKFLFSSASKIWNIQPPMQHCLQSIGVFTIQLFNIIFNDLDIRVYPLESVNQKNELKNTYTYRVHIDIDIDIDIEYINRCIVC